MKFKLGDRITLQKTGIPAVGSVVGIMDARFTSNYNSSCVWDILYPDWREKPIIYMKYDTPQKNLTINEYLDHHPMKDKLPIERLINEYNNLPDYPITCTPIDDCLSLDDII